MREGVKEKEQEQRIEAGVDIEMKEFWHVI